MHNHFKYGHTIDPIQVQDSSENLEDLFKIGHKTIQLNHQDNSSQSTVKQTKKEKKQKKEKEKKVKKDKKHKKEKRRQQQVTNNPMRALQLCKPSHNSEALTKYEYLLPKKLQEELIEDFGLRKKIGDGLLTYDIIKFPQNNIYIYGHMDKQVPRYQRLEKYSIGLTSFNVIIGIKKSKQRKYRQIIKQINQVINQKEINPLRDEISTQRYFHFEGYSNCGFRKINRKHLPSEHFIKFSQAEEENNETKLLQITKQYNKRLNESPKNIELWLNYVAIQDDLTDLIPSKSSSKAAVLDRKISIIEKALVVNPLNDQLASAYLTYLKIKKIDSSVISSQCQTFLMAHPHSVPLLKIYLMNKIHNFSTYSHSYLHKMFKEQIQLLKQTIEKSTSALQVWHIRKSCLKLLRFMLSIYQMEGYTQLAVGLSIALIEFNIFMPEQVILLSDFAKKTEAFVEYWQKYDNYKLGELQTHTTWMHSNAFSSVNHQQYIGLLQVNKARPNNPFMSELQKSEEYWKPAHPKHEKARISGSPDSIVLVEDIEHALLLYRDNDSLLTFVDLLTHTLSLPPIFTHTSILHPFARQILQINLMPNSNKIINFQNQCFYWQIYWPPTQSELVVKNIVKIQYLRRVLNNLKKAMPGFKAIVEYICFINCLYYLNAHFQEAIKFSEQKCYNTFSQLFQEYPDSLDIWTMYINTIFLKHKNSTQCLQCYQQLLAATVNPLKLKQTLLHLYIFTLNHSLYKQKQILYLLTHIIQNCNCPSEQNILSTPISPFQCLILQNHLNQELIQIVTQGQGKQIKMTEQYLTDKVLNLLFALIYTNAFPSLSLSVSQSQIIDLLLSLLKHQYKQHPTGYYFILYFLMIHRLLTNEHIYEHKLLNKNTNLPLYQYWINRNKHPLVLFSKAFDTLNSKSLSTWLTCCLFLRAKVAKQNLPFFYTIMFSKAKVLALDDSILDQSAQHIILLNKLLEYDTNQNHGNFLFCCLNELPFSKQLFLQYLNRSNNAERKKMGLIMIEKNIRIIDKQSILKSIGESI